MSELAGRSPGYPAALPVQPPGRGTGKRRWRMVIVVLLVTVGLAGLGGGGTALYLELTRAPTKAEVAAAGTAEIASRWQRLPAGQVFPATIRYLTSEGIHTTAVRAGIAPAASCQAALDSVVAAQLRRHGCLTVLRATYLDQSGTLAATVGVAVLPGPDAAERSIENLSTGRAGVRAVRFAATRADLFGDAQRARFSLQAIGPYVFFYAAGFADGRRGKAVRSAATPDDLANGIEDRIMAVLTGGGKPCSRKDIRC
ncbi:MAG: hypothetical protein J2P30_19450 [Actinobacteria bacterium]|nr:hypothetical protein [Actinomycetota bacterium]MBO0817308.1 hypothetical protein [Actinomycetota bacterium]